MTSDSRGDSIGQTSSRAGWRAAYFTFQAVATLSWWSLVAVSPAWRLLFAFGDDGRSLLPFLPGDMIFWLFGSLLAARAEWTAAPGRRAVRLVLGGAVAGSFVHAAAAAACAEGGWSGVLLMAPAVLVTGWLAWCADR